MSKRTVVALQALAGRVRKATTAEEIADCELAITKILGKLGARPESFRYLHCIDAASFVRPRNTETDFFFWRIIQSRDGVDAQLEWLRHEDDESEWPSNCSVDYEWIRGDPADPAVTARAMCVAGLKLMAELERVGRR